MLDLYKDLIIDHGSNPRNKYVMKDCTNSAKGFNHLCGDSFELYLKVVGENIESISFNGSGCTISVASASLMTIIMKKKTIASSMELFRKFQDLILNGSASSDLDELCILSNVRKFPSRVKCVTLIWHTFNHALNDKGT
ncbi:MAG: SUF system NifU family Fe-S cluster assembly protein [Enterobacteriaceae bacterium]|nr:SUF system NifU family Fe-S cluster assembly protein [Enterobacteriaceae bacterium]